jgi:hypothetical protein
MVWWLFTKRSEVTVVWGKPGTRQKRIRVVVLRVPYLNENRNENIDVSKTPTVNDTARKPEMAGGSECSIKLG